MTSPRSHSDATWLDRAGAAYLRFLAALIELCARHYRWVLLLAALVTGCAVYFTVQHFAISTDTSRMLSRDLPFQRQQQRLDQAFPQLQNTILIVLNGTNSDLVDAGAERLANWLRHRRSIKGVYQPGGGRFFQQNGLLYLSEKQLWALSNRLSAAQPLVARLAQNPTLPGLVDLLQLALKQQSTSGPQIGGLTSVLNQLDQTLTAQQAGQFYSIPWGSLMAGGSLSQQQGDLRFIVVQPHFDYQRLQPVQAALDTIHQGIGALQLDADHGVTVRVTGSAALDNEQFKTVSQSASLATALSITLVVVLLILGLRRFRMVSSTLTTLFAGLSWTAAFALLSTGPLNLVSVAFAVLFVGLGVDFGIQVCMRYLEERRTGHDHIGALRGTALGAGGSLTLAAIAAAISFFSFVPTNYAGIVDLGLIAGTSMFIALIASLTVLPALLTLAPTRRLHGRLRLSIDLSRLPIYRHAGVIALVATLLTLASLPLVYHAKFDFDPLNLQNQSSEAVKTFRYLLAHSKISPYPIEILEPNLKQARAVAARLQKLDSVSEAVTLASYVPDDQTKKLAIIQQLALAVPPFALAPSGAHVSRPAAIRKALQQFASELAQFHNASDPKLVQTAHRLAATMRNWLAHDGTSQRRLIALEQRAIGSLPLLLRRLTTSLNAQRVTLGSLPQPLRARYVTVGGQARIEVFSNLDLSKDRNMRRFVSAVQQVAPHAAGTPVLLVEGGDAVVAAFREASITSVILIALLLLLTLRNVIDTIVVLIPLCFATLYSVAIMTLAGISFNLANIIVLPLLIGLGVAFGIYLVMRWRRGMSVAELLKTSTPEAVLFSALTTMSSFGSMAVAGDPGMAVLGRTLLIALGSVLLAILIILPALLQLRRPRSAIRER